MLVKRASFSASHRRVIHIHLRSNLPGFEAVEDIEGELACLKQMALILNNVGDIEGRNAVAERICRLVAEIKVLDS